MSSLDWGDVPGWIQAGTATFALVGAAIAVQQSWKVLAIERLRDRAEALRGERMEEDQIAAQARLVSAWSERKAGTRLTVLVANRSELPVYQVRVTVLPESGGEPRTFAEDVLAPALVAQPLEVLLDWVPNRLELEFVDAGGRRWRRDINGSLTRQDG